MKTIAPLPPPITIYLFIYLSIPFLICYLFLRAYNICLNLHAQFSQHFPHTHAQTYLNPFIHYYTNMKTLLLLYDYHKLQIKIKIYTIYAEFIYCKIYLIRDYLIFCTILIHYRKTTKTATHLLLFHNISNTTIATTTPKQITFYIFY